MPGAIRGSPTLSIEADPSLTWTCFPGTSIPREIRGVWLSILANEPRLTSPYFHPAFVEAAAQARPGRVEVAVAFRRGEPVAIMPFEAGRWRIGSPVGAQLSDYQGVVAVDGAVPATEAVLRGAGLSGFRFDHLLSAQPVFEAGRQIAHRSPRVDLAGGFDAWRTGADTKLFFSDTGRKSRKLSREVGEVVFSYDDRARDAWQALFRWKADQYRRTGAPDNFSLPWVRTFLETLAGIEEPGFGAILSTVRAGPDLVAVHFGIQSRDTLHWWFPTYDPAHGRYSPGMVLLLETLRAVPENGRRWLDFGKGDESYKVRLANDAVDLSEGVELLPGMRAFGWSSGRFIGRQGMRALRAVKRRLSAPSRPVT